MGRRLTLVQVGRRAGASRTQAQRARGAGLCRRRPHAVGEAQPDRHLFRHRRGDGRRHRRPRGWCVPTRCPASAGAACAGRARRGRGASSRRAPAAGESSVLLHTYPKRLPSCMSSGGSRAYAKRRLDFVDRASQQVWSARRPPSPPPSCTDWTRLVLLPVLTGHVSSFSPWARGRGRAGTWEPLPWRRSPSNIPS